MLNEDNKAAVVEKWNYFRECSSKKRKRLLDHQFAFYVEYDCGVEDAFRFELDGKEVLIDDACTTMALKHDGKKIDAETVHAVYMASLADGFANVIKSDEYLRA